MKKLVIGIIFLGLMFLVCANQAEAKGWLFGDEENLPEITSLFLGGVEITGMGAKELVLDNSNLEAGNVMIRGFVAKAGVPLAMAKISLDGGQAWEEVGIEGGRFFYQFAPEADREYKPQFKVIDTEGGESDIRDLPRFALIYKPVDLIEVLEQTLQEMIEAYVFKNLPRFSRYISDYFRGDRFALEEAIESDFTRYDNINIDVTVQQVIKSGNEVAVDFEFNWYGIKKSDGSILSPARGSTHYIFQQEEGGYKLLAMASPIIFGISEASQVDTGEPGSAVDDTATTFQTEDTTTTTTPESLTTYSASIIEWGTADQRLDFSTQSVVTGSGGDIQYGIATPKIYCVPLGGSVYINDLGTGSLDDFSEAPEDADPGWENVELSPTAGRTYAVKTSEGNYGLFEVTAFVDNPGGALDVDYKYQSDGTRDMP